MWIKGRGLALVLGTAVALGACAGRAAVPPSVPTVARYPDFVYPAVPASLQRAPGVERIDLAWRFLQSGDTRNAARDFEAALKINPQLYPARAGEGYVALARGDHERALAAFDAALRPAHDYVPALIGRGQTLLAMKRDVDALAAFEAALAADSSLADVRRRVDVLRFRTVEQVIDSARSDASAGRLDRARTAYERAIELSPDSSFLYASWPPSSGGRATAIARRSTSRAPSSSIHPTLPRSSRWGIYSPSGRSIRRRTRRIERPQRSIQLRN